MEEVQLQLPLSRSKALIFRQFNLPFFHEELSVSEVSKLLPEDGDFLLMPYGSDSILLSVKVQQQVYELPIKIDLANGISFNFSGLRSNSLPSLCWSFTIEVGGEQFKLKNPICRTKPFGRFGYGKIVKCGEERLYIRSLADKFVASPDIEDDLEKLISLRHKLLDFKVYDVGPATAANIILVYEGYERNIQEHLRSLKKILSTSRYVSWANQAMSGAIYLADKGICHRRLNPRSCLLDSKGILKLSDIWASSDADDLVPQNEQNPYNCKNVYWNDMWRYSPPETISDGIYNLRSLLWSYGNLIWHIFTHCRVEYRSRFQNFGDFVDCGCQDDEFYLPVDVDLTEMRKINLETYERFADFKKMASTLPLAPKSFRIFLPKCLSPNPEERPLWSEIMPIVATEEKICRFTSLADKLLAKIISLLPTQTYREYSLQIETVANRQFMIFSDFICGDSGQIYQSFAENDYNTRRLLMTSYLSPLSHTFAPRNRSRSYADFRAAALEELSARESLEWPTPPHPRRLPHPLYSQPQRYWRAANGHQPIVTTSGAYVPPHAAAGLRKTQYREPLLSRGTEPVLGRSSELPSGGYWPPHSQYATMAQHQTRAPLSDARSGPNPSGPVGQLHGYSVPINIHPQTPNATNRFETPPPLPAQPPPPLNLSNYYYESPQLSQQPKTETHYHTESRQLPDGTQRFSSYSTSTTTYETQQQQPNIQWPPPAAGFPNTGFPTARQQIHGFATQTPIAIFSPTDSYSQQRTNSTVTTTTERTQKPLSYAEQLRNEALTERQRHSNQFQRPTVADRDVPNSFHSLYENQTIRTNRNEVDNLVRDMEMRLRTTAAGDICAKCSTPIVGDTPGVTALGKPYHVNCFMCDACKKQLAGCSFYSVDGKNLCQVDYMNSLEKCDKCATPITQKILRALGKPYHPECFTCPSCQKSLDGVAFTVTSENAAYCLDCYHDRFSPRCAVCLKSIAPSGNETEVARVIAMDKSYHVSCYRCEDCGLQLNSKVEGAACYPLESHLFCKKCNLERLKATT